MAFAGDQFNPVLNRIVELHLPGLGLRRIQSLEALSALRKLNLSENELQRIEGLELCTRSLGW